MMRFDCNEYWLRTTWDRTRELARLSERVCAELVRQERVLLSSLAKIICNQTGVSIADIGCGPGHVAKTVIDTFGNRISLRLIDLSADALAEARRRIGTCNNAAFHLGQLGNIGHEFPEEFDVVYCLDILHHLSQLPTALRSIRKSLAPGGVLLANAFAKDTYPQWDKLKYGYVRSTVRRVSAALANVSYSWLWPSGRRWIRTRGLGRIAPLSELDLRAAFAADFEVEIHRVGYYYFVYATVRRDA